MHDVCIVGAGPAGLNAALVLGRCGREVVVFDSGQPRNAASRGLHCYLTRDGIHPMELRTLGREEVRHYPCVTFIDSQIATAQRGNDHFDVVTVDGLAKQARILLLATGRVDVLPDIPGFRTFFGKGIYHCPYCDGWEQRGKRVVAYGSGSGAVDLALALLTWTPHLTLASDDPGGFTDEQRGQLAANGVAIATAPVAAARGGPEGHLAELALGDSSSLPCDALFFSSSLPQKSPLAQSLGCQLDDSGSVICVKHAATGVHGLYVAGNVRGGVHLAIMAAAEGAEAAIAINEELSDRALK
jgi:thioredoxin reductase